MSARSPRSRQQPPHQPPHPHRLRHRDQGLRRARQITAWTAAGGLVVTGGLATLAERAFSGQRATVVETVDTDPVVAAAPPAPPAPPRRPFPQRLFPR